MRKKDRDDEDPLAGPNQGKKTKRSRTKEFDPSKISSTSKESSKGKSPTKTSKSGKYVSAEEPVFEMASYDIKQTVDDMVTDADQIPDDSTQTKDKAPKYDRFKQPPRPPTPDPEWKKHEVVVDQPKQPWFNKMVYVANDPLTFDELMATSIDFSKYAMNRLKIDNITQAHVVGPVYELLKGTCKSSIKFEYNMEECFKTLTDKLDWNNPEVDRCPFDLTKPLPLKGRPGRLTVAAEYFFNNDLEFLKSSDPQKKYITSITKTKASRYKIVGIEDMINKFSKHKVYSTQNILSIVSVKVERLHGYDHLEEIVVRRVDRQLYNDIVDFIVALRMFTRSLIIKRRVEDLQLGVESYQKKLNITKPQKTFPGIEFKELHTPSFDPPGVSYEDLNQQKIVMRADELYKFSDRMLKTARDELYHRMLDFQLGYNDDM
ncbi:hypothetical protein Tco_0938568 [Tanacetum coccineum]|uniref:Uncharacterized protein n=1 Tax=Tanacetum coccineum TaxID=301880 RepID=A0ABQ5DJD1_9ASTR